MQADAVLRPATPGDAEALEALIPLSVRALQAPYYTPTQMEAAFGPVFGVDRQLIADGTYFVAECGGVLVGCGGWSWRAAEFGGDRWRSGPAPALDPATDPALVRAFFVHPEWSRRGIGRAILAACEAAVRGAGFLRTTMVATLAGEPLYAACGYTAVERYEVPLPGGLGLPMVRMAKQLSPSTG